MPALMRPFPAAGLVVGQPVASMIYKASWPASGVQLGASVMSGVFVGGREERLALREWP